MQFISDSEMSALVLAPFNYAAMDGHASQSNYNERNLLIKVLWISLMYLKTHQRVVKSLQFVQAFNNDQTSTWQNWVYPQPDQAT